MLAPSAHAASTNVTPKIVNGGNASVTDFPFQALLYVTGSDPASPAGHPENNGGRFCGGVIRDATHVITAAHCVYDAFNPGQIDNPADVSVLVGTDDLAPQDGTAESAAASSLSFDPNYDPDLSLHDLALVTLATPLYNTPTAQIAPFSGFVTNAELEASSQLTVSGWGDTHSEPGSGSQTPVFLNHLQSAQVPFVQDQTCSSDYTFLDTDLVFCAGDAPGPTIADSCQGDSGGPIVFDTSTTPSHQYVLAGLVDSGFGCAQPHFPGIYTRLDNTDLQVWANGNPPGAPSQTNPATIAGGNQPGDTLTCQPGSWSDSSNLSYQFLDADGDVLGSGQTYTIQASDVGSSILCEVKASNAGGYGFGDSSAVTVADAPMSSHDVTPPAVDSTAPKLRVSTKSCTRTTCTLKVHVTDAAPSSGIARVKAVLNYTRRVKCPKTKGGAATKKRVCTRRLHRTLSASAGSAGTYTIAAKKLSPGTSYTISLVPYDRSGNRPSFSTVTHLRTKARPHKRNPR